MNDSHGTTPRPPGQESPQAAGPDPVTSVLQSDAVILMIARRAMAAAGDHEAGLLAARRVLDDEMRSARPWPAAADYAQAAGDFDRLGRPDDAALLRSLAATDALLADAARQWDTRYDDRPPSPADHLIATLCECGLLDYDPAGPFPGTDGAWYYPGAYELKSGVAPALFISGRGSSELLFDWPGFDEMHAWVASRGNTGTGPLTSPPVHGDCRAWQEDQILAHLVNSPSSARHLSGQLPPDTFTTDVRYDVYQAILALTGEAAFYTPEQVGEALWNRLAIAPAHAHSGESAPFPRAYLDRLISTVVTRETAEVTASNLVQEDQQYQALAALPSLSPATRAAAQASTQQQSPRGMAAAQPTATQPALQRPVPPAPPGPAPGPRP